MGQALKKTSRLDLEQLPAVFRIDTPLDHVMALWPGLSQGQPFGNKAVLRDLTGEERSRRAADSRDSLKRRLRHVPEHAPTPYKAKVDDLLWVRRGVSPSESASDIAEIVSYIKSLEGAPDKYISINTFSGRRRHDNLKCLTALAVDLDLLKANQRGPGYGEDFMRMRQDALDFISEAGIPIPNFAVHTGRGVHLYWLFDRVLPAAAFKRWQACLKVLISTLHKTGSDESIKDTARVLRLAGTINSSAPSHCNRVTSEVFTSQRYCFDFLADQILPFTRQQLQEMREARAAKLVEIGPKQAQRGIVVRPTSRSGRQFSATAIARLADLEILASAIYPGGISVGARDKYLFAATCNLAWMCRAQTLETEVLSWKGRFIPSMSDKEALSIMGTAMARAYAAYKSISAGNKESVFDDERYVHSAARLWQDFGEDIERGALVDRMQAILPAGVLKGRQQAARRARSADHYTGIGIRASNLPKARQAHLMKEEGASVRAIAEKLFVAPKTVSSWLAVSAADLNAECLKEATAPHESYPQPSRQDAAAEGVLPKCLLNNGVAQRFLGAPSLMGVAAAPKTVASAQIPATGSGNPPRDVDKLRNSDASVPHRSAAGVEPVKEGVQQQLFVELHAKKPDAAQLAALPGPGQRVRKFDPTELDRVRDMHVPEVLAKLGLHFKRDLSFTPKNSVQKERVHVSLESGHVVELVHTGAKWFDVREKVGSYGGINLAMHLLDVGLSEAIELLMKNDAP